MKSKKNILIGIIVSMLLVIISFAGISFRVKNQVISLFKLNKKLQEECYYMGEFEFHMLGFGYLMGKGNYLKAMKGAADYKIFLSNKENLVKIPDFKSNQDEIDFYLNLQNPKTGAFMDDSAPYCTYLSNTGNIITHLEVLQDSSTKPLKLKYPLTFLDEINTPEKVIAYLNDVSYMNSIGAKFPQTSFHFARDMFSNFGPENAIERNNLYQFSPEWKEAILKWMYDFQDEETGLWGPKSIKNKKLLKYDINNSYSIAKKFRDTNGNDICEGFPLRYGDKLFNAALKELGEPAPNDSDLDWIHEWNLKQVKGMKMLLAFLWKDASEIQKREAQKIISNFIQFSFDKYYVESEGAFSYYPNSDHATVDGMNNMILKRIGALSYARQKRYWGEPEQNAKDFGVIEIDTSSPCNLDKIKGIAGINSWRIYNTSPDFRKLYENVRALAYSNETNVLDITELVPKLMHWTKTSELSTGNWKSMASIINEYAPYEIEEPYVCDQENLSQKICDLFRETSELYIIGFDILQVPRFRVTLKMKK